MTYKSFSFYFALSFVVMFALQRIDPVFYADVFHLNKFALEKGYLWQFVTFAYPFGQRGLSDILPFIIIIAIVIFYAPKLEIYWGKLRLILFILTMIVVNGLTAYLTELIPYYRSYFDVVLLLVFGLMFPLSSIRIFKVSIQLRFLSIIYLATVLVQISYSYLTDPTLINIYPFDWWSSGFWFLVKHYLVFISTFIGMLFYVLFKDYRKKENIHLIEKYFS